MSIGDLAWATVVAVVALAPLAISAWAFLDAARRPSWAWPLADRNQVAWMGAIGLGTITLIGGLVISGWYLLRIRPAIVAAEAGDPGLS